MKSQILVDFMAELTTAELDNESMKEKEAWEIYIDGPVCSEGSGLGIVIKGPHMISFLISNNAAK